MENKKDYEQMYYEELQREYEKPKERRVYEKASTKKEI